MKMAFAFCDANEDGFVDMNDILMSRPMLVLVVLASGSANEVITNPWPELAPESAFLQPSHFLGTYQGGRFWLVDAMHCAAPDQKSLPSHLIIVLLD